eukprot:CAMPEP_0184290626 /NCGR_PEP_ID=MMETSP1049-20130417/2801_1 /TAXON_ID=77928 /ORGANISM="Proteomonas sulcata, Strain CCMP704" /LENGTH=272 /DNA_ID=CAMNT_0026597811 /DNA_START=158 /DNA_END=972 /DNA_ORIENTATION=-
MAGSGGGLACLDVDECGLEIDNCPEEAAYPINSTCTNTFGSFECLCVDGFSFDPQKVECFDYDECAMNQTFFCPPAQFPRNVSCSNTAGSFECLCNMGWEWGTSSCVDVNECDRNTNNCPQVELAPRDADCHNTFGSFECYCASGWLFDPSSAACEDVDECSFSLPQCDCNSLCNNTFGSYACSPCPSCVAPELEPEETLACSDGPCDELANCTDIPGGFNCTCLSGFKGSGAIGDCWDRNECEEWEGQASHAATLSFVATLWAPSSVSSVA